MQECVANSSEEEEVTLDSSTAGPSGASLRTGCSRGKLVVYNWKEISDSRREALQLVMHVLRIFFILCIKCGCFNSKMKCMHVSLCSINGQWCNHTCYIWV